MCMYLGNRQLKNSQIMKNDLLVPVLGSLILGGVIARVSFQYYRNRHRVCLHCGGRNIIRLHHVESVNPPHTREGYARLLSSTTHTCRDKTCRLYNQPEVVKSYSIIVPMRRWSVRRWKYRKHLSECLV